MKLNYMRMHHNNPKTFMLARTHATYALQEENLMLKEQIEVPIVEKNSFKSI
jgi:hypothetical protein